ncbi:HNH endonuclease [Legionella feeleii]|uniref:HNH endonuclease 5 domain-containing protein n=1 Tax=Legionella feeleii TaxID=453 RepID=A0A378J3Z9_9GAMM|nr:HNH endonuclease [Legionella feeleii]STX39014.1 Uncharacterised protein [Legionella feeleii]
MSRCIYCRTVKHSTMFNSREHVIPQSFGKFNPTNLILNDKNQRIWKVCDSCNNNFSKFERWLAKDSYEGYILRQQYLAKPNKKTKAQKLYKRNRIAIVIQEGNFKGVTVELINEKTITLLPQIGLLNKKGSWDYFLIDEVERINKENYQLEEKKHCLKSFALSEEEAIEQFNKIGINFTNTTEFNLPISTSDILCEISTTVDIVIKRAIAKIAFNFFAYFNYKYIVLDKAFDEIRSFILSGGKNISVKSDDKAILADENNSSTRRLGHMIVIQKDIYGRVIAQVSLFNSLKYTILLAERCSHLNIVLAGKFFDLNEMKIIELYQSSLVIPDMKIIVATPKIWLPSF